MPLYVVGGVGARTAPDLRRPKNELMVAAHSAAGPARRTVEGVREVVVVVVPVQAAQGIGVRRGLMSLYGRSRMQNAGVWYDVKAQKGQHGEDSDGNGDERRGTPGTSTAHTRRKTAGLPVHVLNQPEGDEARLRARAARAGLLP